MRMFLNAWNQGQERKTELKPTKASDENKFIYYFLNVLLYLLFNLE